jgi:hypothetical protein
MDIESPAIPRQLWLTVLMLLVYQTSGKSFLCHDLEVEGRNRLKKFDQLSVAMPKIQLLRPSIMMPMPRRWRVLVQHFSEIS